MLELLVELIEHSDKNNNDGQPLVVVDIMFKDKNADDDSEYFAGGGDKGKNVLFKVWHNVVYTDLSQDLQHSDAEDSYQSLRIIYHEGNWISEGTLYHSK